MPGALHDLYTGLPVAPAAQDDRPGYSVAAIPGHLGCFVGKDSGGAACILIAIGRNGPRRRAPIRLENLEVLFGLECVVRHGGRVSEDAFTVIRCRNDQPGVIRYFFMVAEALIAMLGDRPTEVAVANAVNRFAQIFRKLQVPARQAVTGLLGELLLIRQSRDMRRMLGAWRALETSRYDFSAGDVRLDVKAATGRVRSHVFSYDQCSPPPGTVPLAASLFIEQASGGTAVRDVLNSVEQGADGDSDLLLKLHDIVVETLGNGLNEAMSCRFDERLAVSSLQLFDLRGVPGIRGALPVGVSDVHFRSDLSGCRPVSKQELVEAHPESAAFLLLLP
jgi:hypothetical protein